MIDPADVVAIAPMAGRGTRLGLAVSKEVAPLGADTGTVLSSVMLSRMADAGFRKAVLTIADHKQDIRDHFGTRFDTDLLLHYVFAEASPNTPASIDAGYDLFKENVCALGFADILYQPCSGYARALAALERNAADVVLGLFPGTQPASCDMVAFDVSGRVREILIKQAEGARLYYTWSLAVWRPSFTEFLHEWIKDADGASQLGRELFVGDVFIAAQAAGLRVDAAVVSSLGSLDAGTPETLALARSIRW